MGTMAPSRRKMGWSPGSRGPRWLAALVAGKVVVPVVPLAAAADRPSGSCARLDDVGHQEYPGRTGTQSSRRRRWVVIGTRRPGAHDGCAGLAGLVLGGVQVGGQAGSAQDGAADQVRGVPVIQGSVTVLSLLAEWMENGAGTRRSGPSGQRVPHPGGAGKAADVRALVGLAGQAHAGDNGDVVLREVQLV